VGEDLHRLATGAIENGKGGSGVLHGACGSVGNRGHGVAEQGALGVCGRIESGWGLSLRLRHERLLQEKLLLQQYSAGGFVPVAAWFRVAFGAARFLDSTPRGIRSTGTKFLAG
jgi:hypothetical protein